MSKGRRCATDTGRYLCRVDFSGDGKEEKALVLVAVKKTGCRCRIEVSMDETGCRCRTEAGVDEVATGYFETGTWHAGVSFGNNISIHFVVPFGSGQLREPISSSKLPFDVSGVPASGVLLKCE